jgi:hypothetical protein
MRLRRLTARFCWLLRWSATLATLGVVLVWIASYFSIPCGWYAPRGLACVEQGMICVENDTWNKAYRDALRAQFRRAFQVRGLEIGVLARSDFLLWGLPSVWRPQEHWFPGAAGPAWGVSVPMWQLAMASVILGLLAGWLERIIGAETGCRRCGYDLTGLPAGAVCPECGSPPTEPLRREAPRMDSGSANSSGTGRAS